MTGTAPLHPTTTMNLRKLYPTMTPFVGSRVAAGAPPRLLLIGESHYLPKDSTVHLDDEAWYAGVKLGVEETRWISTANIVRGACKAKFSKRAHRIWKNAFHAINEAGPGYAETAEVAEDLVIYNFFQRPAKQGKSLKPTALDATVANDVFQAILREHQPRAVAFVSRRGWWHLSSKETLGLPAAATAHPTSAHWNRVCKVYNNRTGRQVLVDFVRSLDWRS